jgi:AraC-like DNA-binding protein
MLKKEYVRRDARFTGEGAPLCAPNPAETSRRDENGAVVMDYAVVHEIKSPLRAIDEYTCLFIDGYASSLGPDALDMLENIRRICRETIALADKFDEKTELACVRCAEKEMLAMIGANDLHIPAAFARESERLGRLFPPGDSRLFRLCRGLYSNIVSEIFKKYPWLRLYKSAARYEKPENEWQGRYSSDRDDIEEILRFVDTFLPEGVRGTLRSVCDFILENPDLKITLQVISEKFFINRTYLSNLFHQKTGYYFNKYITLVKLSRARFLLENSDKKISEISYCLGYNDFNYFNKIYRKFSGSTPSENRQSMAAAAKCLTSRAE